MMYVWACRRETWTIEEMRRDFERYSQLVNAADLAPSTKATYLLHAHRFVRWLAGEAVIDSATRRSIRLVAVTAAVRAACGSRHDRVLDLP